MSPKVLWICPLWLCEDAPTQGLLWHADDMDILFAFCDQDARLAAEWIDNAIRDAGGVSFA